jgi:hypothetical protein
MLIHTVNKRRQTVKNKYKNIKIICNKTNDENHLSSMEKKYFTHLQSNLKKMKTRSGAKCNQ